MRRKITTIGLALAAALAMGALLAAGAQGSSFTSSSYPAVVTGELTTKHVFTVQGNKVECEEAHFEGSLTAASETINVIPKYNKCTAFGFAKAEVDMNWCEYSYSLGGWNGATQLWEGSLFFDCSIIEPIVINAPASSPLCVVQIPRQFPTTNKVDFANKQANNVLVTSTGGGIHSNVTDVGGFFCPLSNNATDTTGSYTGTVEFKGTEGKTASVS